MITLGDPFDSAENLLGPYEKWMFDAGKIYDLPALLLADSVRLSCVAEFAEPIDPSTLIPSATMIQDDGRSFQIGVPTLYRGGHFRSRFLPFMVSPLTSTSPSNTLLSQTSSSVRDFLVKFKTEPGELPVPQGRFRVNFPIREETVDHRFPETAHTPPSTGLDKPKVLVAIIDLGIPFAHTNFRLEGDHGTRIEYCWSQSAPKTDSGAVMFGREFQRDQINELVRKHNGDEDAIYRSVGLLNSVDKPLMPLDRMHSHGAHVMDCLAGNWPDASAESVRLIAVDLPSSSTWETSGFGKDMFVLSAIHYIFDCADRIKQNYATPDLPLVINLSYGYSGGPHDGNSLIEDAINELITARNQLAPTSIVMPAGNMFQDRLYAQITDDHFADDPSDPSQKLATLDWFAPPNDRTSSYLELWYPAGTRHEDILVEVGPPDGTNWLSTENAQKDTRGFFGADLAVDDRIVGQFTIDHYRNARWRVMLILAPTETAATDLPTQGTLPHGPAPAGIWRLRFRMPRDRTLRENSPSPTRTGIDCRIQRDTSYGQGNTGARQSYFIDQGNPLFAENGALAVVDSVAPSAKLRRFGSINGMATAATTLVVGGHVESNRQASFYSSAGAIVFANSTDGQNSQAEIIPIDKQVDISAPTDRSLSTLGIVAAGTRSGITVALRGTSSAAPQVARRLAMALLDPTTHHARTVPAFLALLSHDPLVQPVNRTGSVPFNKQRLGDWSLTPHGAGR